MEDDLSGRTGYVFLILENVMEDDLSGRTDYVFSTTEECDERCS